jgi:hypothetical protein
MTKAIIKNVISMQNDQTEDVNLYSNRPGSVAGPKIKGGFANET